MKNKIVNNFTLKLLSVVCAFILWIVVMNISDYTVTVKFDDIPVEQLNGDILDEYEQVYDVAKGDTVDIIVRGRRSIVSKLTVSSFTATADLSNLSITNTTQIFVSPKDKSIEDEITITCIDNMMTLNLEDKVTDQFPIKINTTGTPKEGFAVAETSATPNIITIEGPKSKVDKITEVIVSVDVNGKGSSFEYTGDIILYDAYGEPIINDKIKMSQEVVNGNINIYPVKKVDINVNVRGTPGEGYGIKEVIYQPQTVLVAGLEEDLDRIDEIVINDISVSGLTEDLETAVDIKDYLPKGILIGQTDAQVVVTVSIEKLVDKNFKPEIKEITLEGKKNGYIYEITLSEDFEIIALGFYDSVSEVDISKIKPKINCSEFSLGNNNNVTLALSEIDGIKYEIIGSITVKVSASN